MDNLTLKPFIWTVLIQPLSLGLEKEEEEEEEEEEKEEKRNKPEPITNQDKN